MYKCCFKQPTPGAYRISDYCVYMYKCCFKQLISRFLNINTIVFTCTNAASNSL